MGPVTQQRLQRPLSIDGMAMPSVSPRRQALPANTARMQRTGVQPPLRTATAKPKPIRRPSPQAREELALRIKQVIPPSADEPTPGAERARPSLTTMRPMTSVKAVSPASREQIEMTATAQAAPPEIQMIQATESESSETPQPQHKRFAVPEENKPREGRFQKFGLGLLVIGGLVAGVGLQSLAFGLGIIALYALIVLIWKISSRTTFMLALISIIAMIAVLLLQKNTALASNFATYTFTLIAIGTISLIRESPGSARHYVDRRRRS